jgi:hypothetical protein
MMVIVKGFRVYRSWDCSQVQINSGLHPYCISLGEESLLVKAELFFSESINKV